MVSELMSLNGLIYMYKRTKQSDINNNDNGDDKQCCALRNGEH